MAGLYDGAVLDIVAAGGACNADLLGLAAVLDLPRRVLEAIVSEIVAPSEGDIETFPALAPHARALGRELGEGLDEMRRRIAARGFRGLQRGDPSSPEHTLLLLLAAHNGGRVVVSRLIRWALEDPTV